MIQIFAVNISPLRDEACYMRYYEASSQERRMKADRLKQQDDKARCVAAEILLRYAYNYYIKDIKKELARANSFGHEEMLLQAALPEIKEAEHGKPYFVSDVEGDKTAESIGAETCPYFNLSHSGDYVLCAIGGVELGADVQKTVPVRENVVCNYFSLQEQEMLRDFTDIQHERVFAGIWAQKEAAAKLSGRGIGQILEKREQFESSDFGAESGQQEFLKQTNQIKIHHGYIGDRYAWAVAYEQDSLLAEKKEGGHEISFHLLPEGVFFK